MCNVALAHHSFPAGFSMCNVQFCNFLIKNNRFTSFMMKIILIFLYLYLTYSYCWQITSSYRLKSHPIMRSSNLSRKELEELELKRGSSSSTKNKNRKSDNKNDKRKKYDKLSSSSSSESSGSTGGKRILPQGQARVEEISNPNRLRIIGGSAKGKKIESPEVYLRPMMAKVREALFSTLNFLSVFDVEDVAILDTFSGSGSVGLEALSRGANYACFVDLAQDCISTALKNAESCNFDKNNVKGVCARAEQVIRNPEAYGIDRKFDIISITPPYEEVIYKELIDAVCNSPLVKEGTMLIMEYPIEMGSFPHILGEDKFFGIRNRKYGRTMLAIYVYRPIKTFDMRIDEFGV